MKVSIWPENNYYFSHGIHKILGGFKRFKIANVLVVNLSDESLVDFVKSDRIFTKKTSVTRIYDNNQRTLADYYAALHSNVLAAIPIRNCIENIQKTLQGYSITETKSSCLPLHQVNIIHCTFMFAVIQPIAMPGKWILTLRRSIRTKGMLQ